MLASLTATAVRRCWPSTIYVRLVSQLRDTVDSDRGEDTLVVFDTLLNELSLNPLLFEYIWLLSNDANSGLNFKKLLAKFAEESLETRSQRSKDLMSYIARGGTTAWKINIDLEPEIGELYKNLSTLADQALFGCSECKLLITSLVECSKDLIRSIPGLWNNLHEKGFIGTESEHEPSTKVERLDSPCVCSRSTRLLWLDWLIRTVQPFDYNSLKPQLDLLWPNDRDSVIGYELSITAFDILAAPENPPVLIIPFIVKRLPLLLKELIEIDPDKPNSLDTVISRVLTTLDKDVVKSVESRCNGIRAEFGGACIDLGLCEPTVLHSLHMKHDSNPQPPPNQVSLEVFDWTQFPQLDSVNQAELAHELTTAARGYGDQGPMSRNALTKLCAQFLEFPLVADNIFIHSSVQDFAESVCAHADAASQTPEEEGGVGSVYSDLGILLATLNFLCSRYGCVLDESSWSQRFLTRKMFGKTTNFNADQTQLMGQWIVGLFAGSGSGIADELLKPFSELADVLAALLQQAIRAHRSAVIDRETFKNGLDYFLQQFSVTLLGPLAARVFKNDLNEGLHQTTTIECIIYFVTMLLTKQGPEFELVKSLVLPIMQQISTNQDRETGESLTMQRLINTLSPLIDELAQQVESKKVKTSHPLNNSTPDSGYVSSFVTKPVSEHAENLSDSITSAITSLTTWQLKVQGIPSIPGMQISVDAKIALGAERIRELAEKTCLTKLQSPETLCAILVVDGLWAQHDQTLLVNTTFGDKQWSVAAKELFEKLNKARKDREGAIMQAKQKVLIGLASKVEHQTDQLNNVKLHDEMEVTDDIATLSVQSTDPFKDRPQQEDTTNSQLNYPFSASSDQQDFDGDFSQPMNLADLDSAMNFAWD